VPGFSISSEAVGDSADIVKISGSLDAHTFERLEEAVQDLLGRGRYRIVFDLTDVPYVSSAGAGVMIAAVTEAEDNGGKVAVFGVGPQVMEILELLGMPGLVSFAEDRRKALSAVAG
jgi:anti-anti-sigma factor